MKELTCLCSKLCYAEDLKAYHTQFTGHLHNLSYSYYDGLVLPLPTWARRGEAIFLKIKIFIHIGGATAPLAVTVPVTVIGCTKARCSYLRPGRSDSA
jgi:hypothetical protein